MNLPTNILVATDYGESSNAALDYAVALATKLDAKVQLLHVIGVPAYGVPELGLAVTSTMIDTLVKDNQVVLDKLVAKYTAVKVSPILRTGEPRDQIVQTADEIHAELIIMGTHGRRGVSRALLGSVAESVLRHSHCPVLTIRLPKPR